MHFDHVGDGAKAGFGSAEMWVGPTCCTYARPGYPVEKNAPTLSETLPSDGSRKIVEWRISDEKLKKIGDKRTGLVEKGKREGKYEGIILRDPDEEEKGEGKDGGWIKVGSFEHAFDVWGDGSAYVFDAPGHSAGHQHLLVRVQSSHSNASGGEEDSDSFVMLAGDCYHHPDLLKEPRRMARPPYSKSTMHSDPEAALDTITRAHEMSKRDNIWVLGAHDFSIGEAIKPGVKEIEGLVLVNDWRDKGWKKA